MYISTFLTLIVHTSLPTRRQEREREREHTLVQISRISHILHVHASYLGPIFSKCFIFSSISRFLIERFRLFIHTFTNY